MAIGVSTSHQFVQDKFGMTRKNGNWSFNESAVFRRAVVGLIALPVAQLAHHTVIKLRHKQTLPTSHIYVTLVKSTKSVPTQMEYRAYLQKIRHQFLKS